MKFHPTPMVVAVFGPMFSEKTNETISRMERMAIVGCRATIFRTAADGRTPDLWAHNGRKWSGNVRVLPKADDLYEATYELDAVGVDEGHFWDDRLSTVVQDLASAGKVVIVNGLDLDYLRRPFPGPMPNIILGADLKIPCVAMCSQCGLSAPFSYRKGQSTETVLLGAKEEYEARCRGCWDSGMWRVPAEK